MALSRPLERQRAFTGTGTSGRKNYVSANGGFIFLKIFENFLCVSVSIASAFPGENSSVLHFPASAHAVKQSSARVRPTQEFDTIGFIVLSQLIDYGGPRFAGFHFTDCVSPQVSEFREVCLCDAKEGPGCPEHQTALRRVKLLDIGRIEICGRFPSSTCSTDVPTKCQVSEKLDTFFFVEFDEPDVVIVGR